MHKRRLSLSVSAALAVAGITALPARTATAQVSFADVVITTTADGASSAVPVDLDGDGDTDILATAAVDSFQLRWYENNGSESFTLRTVSSNMPFAYAAIAVDVDGDGHLDIVASSQLSDKVSWFENDGSQNFSERTITIGANGADAVFAIDLDGDTDVDILSASRFDDTIAWYENDGNENFTPHAISTIAILALDVTVADLDGDGDLDVLSASGFDDKIAWYENDGEENFTLRTISLTAVDATSVAVADVNGDGHLDVVSASGAGGSDPRIAWHENDGDENFTLRTISTNAMGALSVLAADLDGDGDVDVASASYADDKVAWYENDGNQSFTEHTISLAGDLASTVAAGDIDGDGDLDLVSASGSDDTITWHRNNSVGVRILDISASEGPPITDFSDFLAHGNWTFSSPNCGGGMVDPQADQLTLVSDDCSDSVAHYALDFPGAHADGVASFSWSVSDDSSHQYQVSVGVEGGEMLLLSDSQPSSGQAIMRVPRLGRLYFDVRNDASVGMATLEVTDLTFGTATTAIIVERGTGQPFTVDGGTDEGTATQFDDFLPSLAVDLNFAGFDGETKLLTFDITDDDDPEARESFFFQLFGLSGDSNIVLADGGRGTITINGNDPQLSLDPSVSVVEGDSGSKDMVFTLRLAGDATPAPLQFAGSYSIGTMDGGTATGGGVDHASGGATSILGGGVDGDTFTFSVSITGDTEFEEDETLFVNLGVTSSLISLGNDMAVGTIINDDAAVIAEASGPALFEGGGTATFDVTLLGVSAEGTTVTYATADGTDSEFFGKGAKAGEDYEATMGTLDFTGSTGEVRQVEVPILDDAIPEEQEYFVLNLTDATNDVSIIASFSSLAFITDDDAPQPPTIEDAIFQLPPEPMNGQVLGQLVFDDPNGDIPALGAFAITAGDPDNAFDVTDAGELQVASAAMLTGGDYALTVQVTDATALTDSAAVNVLAFVPQTGGPTPVPRLPRSAPGDRAGASVSLSGGALAVGVPGAEAVGFYDLSSGQPSLLLSLPAPAGAAPGFGSEVELGPDYLIIGTGLPDAGSKAGCPPADLTTQVLQRVGLTLQQFADIKGDQSCGGGGIAFDDEIVLVGNPIDGSVSSFVLNALGLSNGPLVFPTPGNKGFGGNFGLSLAYLQGKLAVGAPELDAPDRSGAVHLFGLVATNLGIDVQPAATPVLTGETGDGFGKSVAVSGTVLVVGAPNRNARDGSVDLFLLDDLFSAGGKGAANRVTLEPPAGDDGGSFGTSVSIFGDILTVGSRGLPVAQGGEGAAYVYELSGLVADLRRRTPAPPGATCFGCDVDVDEDGNTATGAPDTDMEEGEAYVEMNVLFRSGFEEGEG